MMNNYIYEYYQCITDGTEICGHWIKTWYQYIIHGLENKKFFYNQKKAQKVIMFIERFTHHHEGALAPQLIKLELWQKAMLSVMFGIVDENGNRQFREVVVIMGRKNGKTLLASAISQYMAYMDGEYGARIYLVAPKLQQAALCFDACFQSITKEPELVAISKKRRTDIFIEDTNTSIMPLAFNAKKSDGLNPSLCVADEIASWPAEQGLKQYEVIKSALGARKQPMVLSISTAGYVNDGIFDELVKRSTAVLNGGSNEKRLAPFLYMIDDLDHWNDINELRKSMPNLGVSVSVDYMLEEIRIAEGSLSKKTEFLCKYCNIKQNSSTAWLRATDVQKAVGESFGLEDFRSSYCVAGIDLSRTTDLTAATIVIEKNGELYVVAHFWLPGEKIDEASARDGVPYRAFVERGILSPSGENFIDYHDCFNWIVNLVQNYEILPLKVGYDRYSAQYLVQDLNAYGFQCDDVFQGFNLSGVMDELYGLICDGKIHIGDNDLLKIHFMDSAIKQNSDDMRKRLVKVSSNVHIDGMAALLDAMTVRQKWYGEIGAQLANEGG